MTLWTKVKLGILAAVALAGGILSALLSIRTSERDKAITERDRAVETNKSNEKVIETKEAIQDAKDGVDHHSDSRVIDELRQYDRSRNKD